MPAFCAFVLYAVLGLMALRAYRKVRPFRIETPDRTAKYRGNSWQWIIAILAPSNYSQEGHAELRRFWFWLGLFQLGLIGILLIMSVYYP